MNKFTRGRNITKMEMAEVLVDSPAWDGTRDPYKLAKENTWDYLHDMYCMIDYAEDDYYEYLDGNPAAGYGW